MARRLQLADAGPSLSATASSFPTRTLTCPRATDVSGAMSLRVDTKVLAAGRNAGLGY
jgi:hypothetical protein